MISLIKKKGINPLTQTPLYFPQWTRIATTTKTALAKIMARGSTFSVGEVEGTMTDFSQHICDELLSGNAVQIAGLGTFKLKVSGKTHANLADVTSQGCTIAVIFDPDTELTQRLNNEHQFQFVTKPTAEGEQDVNTDNNTTDQKPGSGSDTSDPGQEA